MNFFWRKIRVYAKNFTNENFSLYDTLYKHACVQFWTLQFTLVKMLHRYYCLPLTQNLHPKVLGSRADCGRILSNVVCFDKYKWVWSFQNGHFIGFITTYFPLKSYFKDTTSAINLLQNPRACKSLIIIIIKWCVLCNGKQSIRWCTKKIGNKGKGFYIKPLLSL